MQVRSGGRAGQIGEKARDGNFHGQVTITDHQRERHVANDTGDNCDDNGDDDNGDGQGGDLVRPGTGDVQRNTLPSG